MSQMSKTLAQVKESHAGLTEKLQRNELDFSSYSNIFIEVVKAFLKFSNNLNSIAEMVEKQIISNEYFPQDEQITRGYGLLKTTLLRLSESTRSVASRQKNEVIESLKVFADNYHTVSKDLMGKMETALAKLFKNESDTSRAKDDYYLYCEKLQRHKENQEKMMIKIENGNLEELERYNYITKNLIEKVSLSQKTYSSAVDRANEDGSHLTAANIRFLASLANNEESRIQFIRKAALSSVKIISLGNNMDVDVESLDKMEEKGPRESGKKGLSFSEWRMRMDALLGNFPQQEYMSHEDLMKSKKRKEMEQENAYLQEVFNKVKESDKNIIDNFIDAWLGCAERQKEYHMACRQYLQFSAVCREKVVSLHTYSFYFIEMVYRKMNAIASIYMKLPEDPFNFFLALFKCILNSLDLDGSGSDPNYQLIRKILTVSQRVMKKREREYRATVHLLSYYISSNCPKLRQIKILQRIYGQILNRRVVKKRTEESKSKGMLTSLTKGLFGRRETVTLTEEEVFTCLQEMTHIMANISLPSDVAFSFIKAALPSYNEYSFQYLMDIIIARTNQHERQKLFFQKEIKERKEKQMVLLLQTNTVPAFCIDLTATKGYLSLEDIPLRLLCRSLKEVHFGILTNLRMEPRKKWRYFLNAASCDQYTEKRQKAIGSVLEVDEIIGLDVNRSLHMHSENLKPDTLTRLLHTYAWRHPKLPYCQGMNYLAGYIFIKMRQEPQTYALYEHVMEKYFEEIFAQEFAILKIKMYQYERLLSIFHPELSEHFKRQSITPECYIVSWIITLFASTYQYTLESYLTDLLWEKFILKGWRVFFQFVLWLLAVHKEELLEYNYDKCLHFFGDINRSPFFTADAAQFQILYPKIKGIGECMDAYNITDELLDNFREEYKHI